MFGGMVKSVARASCEVLAESSSGNAIMFMLTVENVKIHTHLPPFRKTLAFPHRLRRTAFLLALYIFSSRTFQ